LNSETGDGIIISYFRVFATAENELLIVGKMDFTAASLNGYETRTQR